MSLQRRSFLLVIAAPSGAGKTSLARALVERHEDVVFSVSATTRAARDYERGGKDYVFVDQAEFDRMRDAGELIESAVVHGRCYGTPWKGVRESLDAGNVVVLDIDVQGARQIRERFADAVHVFVLPPSGAELERRLTGRGSEQRESLRFRLANARTELPDVREFDYAVVNEHFDQALAALEAIVAAERHRVPRLHNLEAELDTLDRDISAILDRSE